MNDRGFFMILGGPLLFPRMSLIKAFTSRLTEQCEDCSIFGNENTPQHFSFQIFVTPKEQRKSKPYHDHVFVFSIVDDHIWFRREVVCFV